MLPGVGATSSARFAAATARFRSPTAAEKEATKAGSRPRQTDARIPLAIACRS